MAESLSRREARAAGAVPRGAGARSWGPGLVLAHRRDRGKLPGHEARGDPRGLPHPTPEAHRPPARPAWSAAAAGTASRSTVAPRSAATAPRRTTASASAFGWSSRWS